MKINNEEFNISEFADPIDILNIYAVNHNLIPELLKIVYTEDENHILIYNIYIYLEDIYDITNINKQYIDFLLLEYPMLNSVYIGILWIKIHGIPSNLDVLKIFSKSSFTSISNIKYISNKFEEFIEKRVKSVIKHVNYQKDINIQMEKFTSVLSDNIAIEEYTKSIFFTLIDDLNIYELFDSFITTQYIPFIKLFTPVTTVYKSSSVEYINNSWFSEDVTNDNNYGIYFKFTADTISYTNCYWNINNILLFTFIVNDKYSEEYITDLLLKQIHVKYYINHNIQISMKGNIKVYNKELNKIILSDMIFNDKLLKYYLYFNEIDKTMLHKKKIYIYYNNKKRDISSSGITFVLTYKKVEEEEYINIK